MHTPQLHTVQLNILVILQVRNLQSMRQGLVLLLSISCVVTKTLGTGKSCSDSIALCHYTPSGCTPGSIQLTSNGLLEMCSGNEWLSVCASEEIWTDALAEVACRQLEPNSTHPRGTKLYYIRTSSITCTTHSYNCF